MVEKTSIVADAASVRSSFIYVSLGQKIRLKDGDLHSSNSTKHVALK